jgi:hypothetical protein
MTNTRWSIVAIPAMHARRWMAALIGLLAGACASSGSPVCRGGCVEGEEAELQMSCPTIIASAVLTGVCARAGGTSVPPGPPDAASGGGGGPEVGTGYGFSCGATTEFPFAGCRGFYLAASAPGDCHVELTFANGSTYVADIQFEQRSAEVHPGCPPCPPYIAPTQATFVVANPSDTCVTDAGGD